MHLRRTACLLLCVLVVSTGCTTHARKLADVRSSFFAGDLQQAETLVAKRVKDGGHGKDVFVLDQALVELTAGRPKKAEELLRQVRDKFEDLENSTKADVAVAMVTDDRRLDYAGEDYEKVLIRSFLAISNLLRDGSDAYAYGLQVNEKQQQIIQAAGTNTEENLKLQYKRVALGAYVQGALVEATHNNWDDVTRSYQKVVEWEPDFRFGQADLQRAQQGQHSQPGNGVLYVITLVGQGPYKEETYEIPSQVALLIADRIVANNTQYSMPPTIAPVPVPKLKAVPNTIEKVCVGVDGEWRDYTATITDVTKLAIQQHEAVYPQIVARAIVRRVVKKGVITASKAATGVERDSLTNLAMDVVGVAWEFTEAADTRCWGVLPDKIQVLRLELPAGDHQIKLQPFHNLGPWGTSAERMVKIENGRNTYLLANFPEGKLVGEMRTNHDPEPVAVTK